MFEDQLVSDRSEELDEELQSRIHIFKEEKRLKEIYDFIIKYRPGIAIKTHRAIRGSYNAIFHLEYTDGAAAMRVALRGSNAFADEKVRVEVATLRYIEKMTSVPVPHVYHWGTAAENPLGLGAFIIMDYIPHDQDLHDVLRNPSGEDGGTNLDPNIPKDKLERMYKQAAGIMLQLSSLEMPRIGSLQQHGDSFIVGGRPLTQEMNDLVVQGGIPPSVLPPENKTYSTSDEWYEALADMHVAHLTFQHNDAIDSADDCRDKFVARHLFRQWVRQGKLIESETTTTTTTKTTTHPTKQKQTATQSRQKETFHLWIEDFRPHNILLDADLNIAGVIDWEWAYFAPRSFRHDPPWWLLLGRPENWLHGSVLRFRDTFGPALDVFLGALRSAEEDELDELLRQQGSKEREEAEEEAEEEEEWSIDQHIEALSLGEKEEVRLSECMRRSWESGAFWANYAARRTYGFEPVFWEFLDERWFGGNVEGGYEGRLNLLSEKVKNRMETFVERKVAESKDRKIVEWEPEKARAYLAEILADLE
jgi:aminoglycoside phosphotransferase (APT) family kinase protein